MLIAILPREGTTVCRVVGLRAVREGGVIRVGLLLCDGAIPAQDAPARFFDDQKNEERVWVRLPELQDGIYDDIYLEVIHDSEESDPD